MHSGFMKVGAALAVLLPLWACSEIKAPLGSIAVIGPPSFEDNAGGRPALSDRQWDIASSDGEPIGIIASLVTCAHEAFLLDVRPSRIHRLDLDSDQRTGTIGLGANGDEEAVEEPRSLAVDCSGHRLYVLSVDGIAVVSEVTGHVVQRVPLPSGFQPRGNSGAFEPETQTLYFSGLWPAVDYRTMEAHPDRMLAGARVGIKVSIDSWAHGSMFEALEAGCAAFTGECWESTFDRVAQDESVGWIMAHGSGATVGLFDRHGRALHALDVTSPLFRRDGTTVPPSSSLAEKVAWRQRNSAIVAVFAASDRVVVVHTLYRDGFWVPGQWIQFDVYMNVYTLDGRGVVSDLRLPDLPVGRDQSGVFVVDYGAEGRRAGADRIRLVHVAVPGG